MKSTHDRRGQVLTASQEVGTDTFETSYEYTQDGFLAAMVYPSGRRVEYTPDFAGRPTEIRSTAPGSGTAVTILADAEYLPSGPPTTLERGPSAGLLAETRGYDWQYRQTSQSLGGSLAGPLLGLSRTYDPAGNLTDVVDALGARGASYGYDDLGRLTSADWTGASRGYEYDPIGNLERLAVDTGLPGEGELLLGYDDNGSGGNTPVLESTEAWQGGTPLSSFTVTTDVAGNVTGDGQAGYDYTLTNHLASRTLGTATTEHTFAADGRRVRSHRTDTGATSDFVLGLGGQRLARRDGAGLWRDYVFLGGQLLAYFDDGADDPIQVVSDHIGMPMMAVDGAGTVVWEALAEPYGELRGTVSQAFDPGLRYPGQWQDELDLEADCAGGDCTLPGPLEGSVSLFENGYRWYRAGWGRYTQSDPLGLFGDSHSYAYARSSPLQFYDPRGLQSLTVCCDDSEAEGIRARIERVADLQTWQLNLDLPYPGPGQPTPGANTICRWRKGSTGAGEPLTRFKDLGQGPCLDACNRVHEQFHRDRCSLSLEQNLAGSSIEEPLAYLAEYECLKNALMAGKATVDVDPFGPGNLPR